MEVYVLMNPIEDKARTEGETLEGKESGLE